MVPRRSRDKALTRLERAVRNSPGVAGLPPGSLLVVAVSGGPDSLALLYALHTLQGELGLRLHGAHLDHGLRDAAAADRRFVIGTFKSLGLASTVEAADVAALRQRRRLSLEEAAREARYAFLARTASDRAAAAVALGHTSDDQAETVLMHIIRGSGLSGLRGMEPVVRRSVEGRQLSLLRPLLDVTRAETEAYCRQLDIQPRRDASNESLEFSRNRVRLELLPMLERHNPGVKEALVRLSLSASRDLSYLERCVDEIWGQVTRRDGDALLLDREALRRLAPALQFHLLRRAMQTVKGNLSDIEQNHLEAMLRLAEGPAGKRLCLPAGLRFSVGYTHATLAPSSLDMFPSGRILGEHPIEVPGETLIPGWRVEARLVHRGADDAARPPDNTIPEYAEGNGPLTRPHVVRLDAKALDGRVVVRSRRPGDRLQPLGMAGTKKLQDFMVDAKIPREQRDLVPLVVSHRGIAWVVGWRIADWARFSDDADSGVELRFTRR